MEKSVMVFGIDDSDCSSYALEWTLQHFFSASPENHLFKLVVVHAKPHPSSTVGFAGPASVNLIPIVDADLKMIAARVLDKAKETCAAKSRIAARVLDKAKKTCAAKWMNDVIFEVVEGDPRNVLYEAVAKHNATVLALGSHGYGAIKRAVLGSVSDYCAHHAHCSVMIVKKPKTKH